MDHENCLKKHNVRRVLRMHFKHRRAIVIQCQGQRSTQQLTDIGFSVDVLTERVLKVFDFVTHSCCVLFSL